MISNVGSTPLPLTTSGNGYTRPASGAPTAASLTVATAQRSVDGQLQLTTKEGDTVTLSAHADASITYANLRGRSPEGRVAARAVSLEANREFSIQVQGELSEQELAEIQKVVKSFLHELKDAFRGRDADAGEVAEAGDGATTLANFSVHIESSSSLSVVSLIARPRPEAAPLPVQRPEVEGEAATQFVRPPASPLPVQSPIDDASGTDGSAEPARSAQGLGPIVGRLVSAARRANLAADKLDRVLDHIFRQFGRELRTDGARQVLAALQQGVRQGVSQAAPPEATPDTEPQELPAVA